MARTYKRDASGRFASGGGSSGGGRSGGKAAAKSKPAKRSAPKTTSARGRALQNQRRAAALVSASRGGTGPSAKAVRSVLTAQRARAFYAATGGGKKRSAVKPATKKTAKATAAAVRARTKGGSGAKAATSRAKVAGRAKAGTKSATQRPAAGQVKQGRQPSATKSAGKKVDYAGAVAAVRARDRSIKKLEQNQYANTAGGNFAYNADLNRSKLSSGAYVRSSLRNAISDLRQAQRMAKSYNYEGRPDLVASTRAMYRSQVPVIRRQVVGLVRTLRAFYPAYQQETIKRVEAARSRSASGRRRRR